MNTALIVDDENKARENLKDLIEEFCAEIKVVGTAGTIDDAVKLIGTQNPDIVFLDIKMKRETGFDLLERIDNIKFKVIFTTAFSEYAIKAFRFSAIDYLLKPISIDELQQAIKKAGQTLETEKKFKEKFDILLQNLKSDNASKYKIVLPTSNGLVFLKLSEIIYCEGSDNYTTFYTTSDRKFIVCKTLKEYEDMLADHDFFRIHKSYLVNLKEIKEYIRGEGGYVIMNNRKSLDVSRRRREPFLVKIGNLI